MDPQLGCVYNTRHEFPPIELALSLIIQLLVAPKIVVTIAYFGVFVMLTIVVVHRLHSIGTFDCFSPMASYIVRSVTVGINSHIRLASQLHPFPPNPVFEVCSVFSYSFLIFMF